MHLPTEVWTIIASFIPTNPILYTYYASICKSAFIAFRADKLWRHLNPFPSIDHGFAQQFMLRVVDLTSEQKTYLRDMWSGQFIVRYAIPPPDSLDFKLAMVLRRQVIASQCAEINDAQFMMCAAYYDYRLLKVSELLRDQDFMTSFLRLNGMALQFMDPTLLDEYMVELAVSQYGGALQFVPDELKSRAVVEAAVKSSGDALQFAPEFQSDRDIVLFAVYFTGTAVQFASEELRSDREVIISAVRSWPQAINFAAPCLAVDPGVRQAAFGSQNHRMPIQCYLPVA